MIKELLTLAKMLLASKPSDVDKVEVVDMRHFPFKGYKAMAWCGCVIHRMGASAVNEKTLNHERIHLMQAKVCGSWVKYYLSYLWEWMRIGFMSPLKANYYTSKYESEAFANEDDYGYCDGYDGSNLSKYEFKNRKKLYKDVGWSAAAWKKYVKSL